jgi:hypothetical protein
VGAGANLSVRAAQLPPAVMQASSVLVLQVSAPLSRFVPAQRRLNEGRTPHVRGVRVALGTGYNLVEGNRRASRNGRVSDLSPETPNVTIRNLCIACTCKPTSPLGTILSPSPRPNASRRSVDQLGLMPFRRVQMEIPLEQNWLALSAAHAAGVKTILNNAPAGVIPAAALSQLQFLVVNEAEARDVAEAHEPSIRSVRRHERCE